MPTVTKTRALAVGNRHGLEVFLLTPRGELGTARNTFSLMTESFSFQSAG